MTMKITRMSLLVACLLCSGGSAAAQTLEGTWMGTLGTGDTAVRLVIGVQRGEGGALTGGVYSLDRGIPNTFDTIAFGPDRSVRFASTRLRGRYEGVLSADGREIVGAWIEGDRRRPLTLTRTHQHAAVHDYLGPRGGRVRTDDSDRGEGGRTGAPVLRGPYHQLEPRGDHAAEARGADRRRYRGHRRRVAQDADAAAARRVSGLACGRRC